MAQGVNGESILVRLPGFDHALSVPHDFMHLIEENIKQHLIDLWTGHFIGLDTGNQNYQIPAELWELIGEETSAVTTTIPASFVRTLPDIATKSHLFTAETWCFWFVYMAP